MSGADGKSSKITTGEVSLNHSTGLADLPSNTPPYFDAWLKSIQPLLSLETNPDSGRQAHPSGEALREPPPVEFRFEGGALRIDCYVTGLVRSKTGTLVVSENGEVDTDLFVPVAIVDGLVRGDIKATERVELGKSAKVIGNIETPSLRIEPGAIFEGHCHFVQSSARVLKTSDRESSAEVPRLSVIRTRGDTSRPPEQEETEPLVAAVGR